MTPSFMGRMATMLPGVRPSISLASFPTASTSPVVLLMATMDGSLTTMPLPLAKTSVFAVPRSMARSDEKRLKRERKFMLYGGSLRTQGELREPGAESNCMVTYEAQPARAFIRTAGNRAIGRWVKGFGASDFSVENRR